jgi:hypothetical protein
MRQDSRPPFRHFQRRQSKRGADYNRPIEPTWPRRDAELLDLWRAAASSAAST